MIWSNPPYGGGGMWCHQFALTHHTHILRSSCHPVCFTGSTLVLFFIFLLHSCAFTGYCWNLAFTAGRSCTREDAERTSWTPLSSLSAARQPDKRRSFGLIGGGGRDLGRHWERKRSQTNVGLNLEYFPLNSRVMMKRWVLLLGILLLLSFSEPRISRCFWLLLSAQKQKGGKAGEPTSTSFCHHFPLWSVLIAFTVSVIRVCVFYAHEMRINSCVDPIHADG